MDISRFLVLLLENLSDLGFVEKVDIQTEVFVLKGRAILKKKRFLHIYFNQLTGTTAFALIEKDRRIWGIDYDNTRGWHIHPLEHPETHLTNNPLTPGEIIHELSQVWPKLP